MKKRSKKFNLFSHLKTKLMVSFAFMLIIPTITIGTISYKTARDAVKNEQLLGFSENVNIIDSTIDSTIEPIIHDLDTFSEIVRSDQYQNDGVPNLRNLFGQYIQFHPQATAIYVGTDDGKLIEEPKSPIPEGYDPRKRDWYKNAMEKKGETIISDPYMATTGDLVIAIAHATKDGSGVIGIDISLSYLQKLTSEVKIGETGFAFLVDKNGKYISHPTEAAGTESKEDFTKQIFGNDNGVFEYIFEGKPETIAFATNILTGWKLVGAVEVAETQKAATPILKTTLIVIGIAIILGVIAVFFIIKSIIKPINILKEKAVTISKGDLTEHIEVKTNDEIGQLGLAFNEMKQSLTALVKQFEQHAEHVAASSEQLNASAEQTANATAEVASSFQEVAIHAEKQTTRIEQNVKSIDKINVEVTHIADFSMKVKELSDNTTKQAEDGGKAVTNTVNQMKAIHKAVLDSNEMIKSLYERSREVSTILDVITGISEQTNLLSLNAAIEAARAGEHGKGFAIVANEVRKLAEQSSASAKQIYKIVQAIQQDTESSVRNMARVTKDVSDGVSVSQEAIEKFDHILKSTKEMTPQMEKISVSAQEIASGIQEVSAITNELAIIAQTNAATAEEVAASSEEQLASMEEISTSAKSLSNMAEELTEIVAKFKY